MKKYILLLVFASAITSCQKYRPGGNPDVLKLNDSIVKYDDKGAPKSTYVQKSDSEKVAKPDLIEPDLMVKKVPTETVAKPTMAK